MIPDDDDALKIGPANRAFDESALETYFNEHFIALSTFCSFRYKFDLHQAKEIVHTAFIRLWEHRASILSHTSVKAYLYRTVSNLSQDFMRHEQVKIRHERFVQYRFPDGPTASGYDNVDYKDLRDQVDKAVGQMPEQMRAVFILSRYEGLKYLQISNRLGISVKTVETQISRALARLRPILVHYLLVNLALLYMQT